MITKTDKTSETRIIREFLARRIENERQRWNHCLALTMIWGLIAHGYGFLNFTINHDSLNEFYLSVTTPWKITLGRFLSPFLRYVMGEVMTLPWLNGLTGLIFAGLACYFISKMFKLDIVWENILLTGISITNITVTALIASYIHDFSGDMLALLLSVCSVYAWDKMSHAFSMKYTLFGIACLAASLGLYQGYLSVAITLMCLKMIVDLLNGQSRVAVFRKIWHAILLGIGSLLAYMLCSSIVLRIYGLKFNSYGVSAYNFIAEPIAFIKSIIKGYIYVIEDVLFPNYESSIQSVFPSAAFLICLGNLFLTCYAGKIFVDSLKKGGISRWTVALLIFLIICLPVCMICVCIFLLCITI